MADEGKTTDQPADAAKSLLSDADAKPADTPPADAKPKDDAKPSDAKPDAAKSLLSDADAKPADTPPTDAKPKDDAKPDDKAPEAVDWTKELKAPEGKQLDTELVGVVGPLFSELKLTAEQGRKLADGYNALVLKREQQQQQDFLEARAAMRAETQKTVSAEDMAFAKRAFTRVFDEKTRALIESSGMGDHAGFISSLARFGRLVSDDSLPGAGAAGGKEKRQADVLFE